jgi:hypothetical protein
MSLSRSRRGSSLSALEIESLVDSALNEALQLTEISRHEGFKYYCSLEDNFHDNAMEALVKAAHVLSKLKRMGVPQTPKFRRVQQEVQRAKHHLIDQYRNMAAADYASASKMDPACHDLGYGAI